MQRVRHEVGGGTKGRYLLREVPHGEEPEAKGRSSLTAITTTQNRPTSTMEAGRFRLSGYRLGWRVDLVGLLIHYDPYRSRSKFLQYSLKDLD